MSIGQRIGYYIEELGITQDKFAIKCGVTRQTINNAIKGKYETRGDVLARIITACQDLNARWLLTGEGSMYAANGATGSIIKGGKHMVSEPEIGYSRLKELEEENNRLKDELLQCKDRIIEIQQKLIDN